MFSQNELKKSQFEPNFQEQNNSEEKRLAHNSRTYNVSETKEREQKSQEPNIPETKEREQKSREPNIPETKEREQKSLEQNIPEIKEREIKINVSSDEPEQEEQLPPIHTFLSELYGAEPLYYDDIKPENIKKKEPPISQQIKDFEIPLTKQIIDLIYLIKLELNKERIYKNIRTELKLDRLNHKQKKLLYSRNLDLTDPLHKLFQDEIKQIPVDKWDDVPHHYFSSFSPGTKIPYHTAPGFEKFNEECKEDRMVLFQKSKHELEEIVYELRNPKLNASTGFDALNNLYTKIGVCALGFTSDIQAALTELKLDVHSILLKCIDEFAKNYLIKLNESRVGQLNYVYPGMETHERSHLINNLATKYSDFKIPVKKERLTTMLSQEEYDDFETLCLEPNVILNAMVDAWEIAFTTKLINMKDSPFKEENLFEKQQRRIHNKKIVDNFMLSLNNLGKTIEDIYHFFNETDGIYYTKSEKDFSAALRSSIYKRLTKSGILPQVILPRIIQPIGKKLTCDVITTSTPYIHDLPYSFISALSESKADCAYVLQNNDRQYDYINLGERKISQNSLIDFLPDEMDFGYAFLKNDKKIYLYFLQRDPATIKEIKNVNQAILRQILADKPLGSLKTHLDKHSIKKIHQLNMREHAKRTLYFVKKDPFTVYHILRDNEDDVIIYKNILSELRLHPLELFTQTTILDDKEAVYIISKLTDHTIQDTIYITSNSLKYSYVNLQRLADDEEPILSLYDYIKKNADDNNIPSKNQVLIAELKSLNLPILTLLQLLECTDLKNEDIVELITQHGDYDDGCFQHLFYTSDFNIAGRLLEVDKKIDPTAFFDSTGFEFVLHKLIDNPNKLQEFIDFGRKYMSKKLEEEKRQEHSILIKDIFIAAEMGQLVSLAILIELFHKKPVVEKGTQEANQFRQSLIVGLEKLIKAKKYMQANQCIALYFSEEKINPVTLNNEEASSINSINITNLNLAIYNTMKEAIEKNDVAHFTSILRYLPDYLYSQHFVSLAKNAALTGNVAIMHPFREHKIVFDEGDLLISLIQSLTQLINGNKYDNAINLIAEYPILLETVDKESIRHQLREHAKNGSEESQEQLKKLLKVIERLGLFDSVDQNGIKKNIINFKDTFGNPPLFYAAYAGNFKAIDQLIAAGADIDAKPNNDQYDYKLNLLLFCKKCYETNNIDKMNEMIDQFPFLFTTKITDRDQNHAIAYAVGLFIRTNNYNHIIKLIEKSSVSNEVEIFIIRLIMLHSDHNNYHIISELTNLIDAFSEKNKSMFYVTIQDKLLDYISQKHDMNTLESFLNSLGTKKNIILNSLITEKSDHTENPLIYYAAKQANFKFICAFVEHGAYTTYHNKIRTVIFDEILAICCKKLLDMNNIKGIKTIFAKFPQLLKNDSLDLENDAFSLTFPLFLAQKEYDTLLKLETKKIPKTNIIVFQSILDTINKDILDFITSNEPEDDENLKKLLQILNKFLPLYRYHINDTDDTNTPLIIHAAKSGNMYAIKLLIEAGATTECKPNKQGETFESVLISLAKNFVRDIEENTKKLTEIFDEFPFVLCAFSDISMYSSLIQAFLTLQAIKHFIRLHWPHDNERTTLAKSYYDLIINAENQEMEEPDWELLLKNMIEPSEEKEISPSRISPFFSQKENMDYAKKYEKDLKHIIYHNLLEKIILKTKKPEVVVKKINTP